MSYMSQETKKEIIKLIKEEFTKKAGWKFSFGVENHSILYCRILEAPIDFSDYIADKVKDYEDDCELQLGGYKIEQKYKGTESYTALLRIDKLLNTFNYNNSDVMRDYFDVGYYTSLHIGFKNWKTNKFTPFKFTGVNEGL